MRRFVFSLGISLMLAVSPALAAPEFQKTLPYDLWKQGQFNFFINHNLGCIPVVMADSRNSTVTTHVYNITGLNVAVKVINPTDTPMQGFLRVYAWCVNE